MKMVSSNLSFIFSYRFQKRFLFEIDFLTKTKDAKMTMLDVRVNFSHKAGSNCYAH